jgi:hypothetical protein
VGLESGLGAAQLTAGWAAQRKAFRERIGKYLLY